MRGVEDYDVKLILFESLFESLEAAKQGETAVMTRGGQPVAHFSPALIESPYVEPRFDLSGEREKAMVSRKKLKTQMRPA